MPKKFNITGTCLPHLHYMMDNGAKLAEVMEMIEAGAYFTINRPRQYGKTTTLAALYKQLEAHPDFIAISLDLQGKDASWFESDTQLAQLFVRQMHRDLKRSHPELAQVVEPGVFQSGNLDDLSDQISDLVAVTDQKLVLLIDEVDSSSNYDSFLRFLAMLRRKYLRQLEMRDETFHSVILAGVHDIKSLKLKVREGQEGQYNSPWNIAADFEVEMSFRPHEIAPMLVQYSEAEQVEIDVAWFAERLYYYTSGYPFLVSKLCKTIAEKLTPKKSERHWTPGDLEEAVQMLLRENNTLFTSLIKNLENNPDLYSLTQDIIINGSHVPFNPHEPVISLGRLYGVFRQNGTVKVHNRIYEQVLYDYLTAKMYQAKLAEGKSEFLIGIYEKPDGSLDLEKVLLRFQQFLREQYSAKDQKFLERQWRLVFLAFFKPILNGKGHDFKEAQISDEKRLDVVATYLQHKYIIELKRWYGPSYHQKGLDQLADYLDRQGVDEGYLIIFEGTREKSQRQEWIEHRGKRVFAVWV